MLLLLILYDIYRVTVVLGTREAALDAQIISLVSDLGDEQLRNIKTDIVTFDARVFNQKIVSTCYCMHGVTKLLCVVDNARRSEIR